jgi:hypothetical protein
MIKLPASKTSMLKSRVTAGAFGVAIRFRLKSLVVPSSGNSAKIHTQFP